MLTWPLFAQARQKRHSTSEEAVAAGCSSGAYRTILTHFSQRYPKLPPGLETEAVATAGIAVAFDGMRVPLTALSDLPQLLPVLQHAWAETILPTKAEGPDSSTFL